jgi:hypothetical protein
VIDTFGSAFDTVLSVHRLEATTGQPRELIGCNDDAGSLQSRLDLNLEAGWYLVTLDGYHAGASGAASLRIDLTP